MKTDPLPQKKKRKENVRKKEKKKNNLIKIDLFLLKFQTL